MEQIAAVLEREGELLDILSFKLVETRLLLESGEHRFLARATREVERARRRTREADLVRAACVADLRRGTTLRTIATQVPEPWPGILRDHHERLTALVAEIELTAHRNADLARCGLDSLRLATVSRPVGGVDVATRTGDEELARLARGAAFETVLATAARLRMPDLLDFLR
ncbi:MAG: hypothetical protein R2746_03675 [Acidimicrobiales bacterium]|nr:hypothetical protein [Actinomycetota bacterium]